MSILRRASSAALWLLAILGVLCGAVWAATAAGVIKPLVVISGSMEPGIMTGDLLIDVRVPTADLAVGDVASLRSDLNPNLITHRIESITRTDAGYTIAMRGDNNAAGDALDYTVGDEVWQPVLQLPGVGTIVQRLVTPAVAVPLLIGLLALLGLNFLIPPSPAPRRRPATA